MPPRVATVPQGQSVALGQIDADHLERYGWNARLGTFVDMANPTSVLASLDSAMTTRNTIRDTSVLGTVFDEHASHDDDVIENSLTVSASAKISFLFFTLRGTAEMTATLVNQHRDLKISYRARIRTHRERLDVTRLLFGGTADDDGDEEARKALHDDLKSWGERTTGNAQPPFLITSVTYGHTVHMEVMLKQRRTFLTTDFDTGGILGAPVGAILRLIQAGLQSAGISSGDDDSAGTDVQVKIDTSLGSQNATFEQAVKERGLKGIPKLDFALAYFLEVAQDSRFSAPARTVLDATLVPTDALYSALFLPHADVSKRGPTPEQIAAAERFRESILGRIVRIKDRCAAGVSALRDIAQGPKQASYSVTPANWDAELEALVARFMAIAKDAMAKGKQLVIDSVLTVLADQGSTAEHVQVLSDTANALRKYLRSEIGPRSRLIMINHAHRAIVEAGATYLASTTAVAEYRDPALAKRSVVYAVVQAPLVCMAAVQGARNGTAGEACGTVFKGVARDKAETLPMAVTPEDPPDLQTVFGEPDALVRVTTDATRLQAALSIVQDPTTLLALAPGGHVCVVFVDTSPSSSALAAASAGSVSVAKPSLACWLHGQELSPAQLFDGVLSPWRGALREPAQSPQYLTRLRFMSHTEAAPLQPDNDKTTLRVPSVCDDATVKLAIDFEFSRRTAATEPPVAPLTTLGIDFRDSLPGPGQQLSEEQAETLALAALFPDLGAYADGSDDAQGPTLLKYGWLAPPGADIIVGARIVASAGDATTSETVFGPINSRICKGTPAPLYVALKKAPSPFAAKVERVVPFPTGLAPHTGVPVALRFHGTQAYLAISTGRVSIVQASAIATPASGTGIEFSVFPCRWRKSVSDDGALRLLTGGSPSQAAPSVPAYILASCAVGRSDGVYFVLSAQRDEAKQDKVVAKLTTQQTTSSALQELVALAKEDGSRIDPALMFFMPSVVPTHDDDDGLFGDDSTDEAASDSGGSGDGGPLPSRAVAAPSFRLIPGARCARGSAVAFDDGAVTLKPSQLRFDASATLDVAPFPAL